MNERWLLLVRHAKSSWKEPLPDFERPLNKRGLRDGPRMARRIHGLLSQSGRVADLLFSSPARRAAATAQMFADALQMQDRLAFDSSLYHADANTIIERVSGLPAEAMTVLIVGHNPALEEAVGELCGQCVEHLPTAAVAVLSGAANDWSDFAAGSCQLALLDYPKRMAA